MGAVLTLSCLLLLLSASPLFAQRMQLGFSGLLVFPQGAFKERAGRPGGGVSVLFTIAPVFNFALIGGEVGFWTYGTEGRRERDRDVITSNSALPAHLLLRLQPRQGAVQPYLDGLAGFHYLFTTTSSRCYSDPRQPDVNACPIVFPEINLSDFVFSYGGGAGVMIRLREGQKKDADHLPPLLMLDLRARYLYGSPARYLKKGSIRQQNTTSVHDVSVSRTDALTVYAGVVIEF